MDNLTSTMEGENAEQGLDWEETIEQAAYEQQRMKEAGLSRTINVQNANEPTDPEKTAG